MCVIGGVRHIGYCGDELFSLNEEKFGKYATDGPYCNLNHLVPITVMPSNIIGVTSLGNQVLIIRKYSIISFHIQEQKFSFSIPLWSCKKYHWCSCIKVTDALLLKSLSVVSPPMAWWGMVLDKASRSCWRDPLRGLTCLGRAPTSPSSSPPAEPLTVVSWNWEVRSTNRILGPNGLFL